MSHSIEFISSLSKIFPRLGFHKRTIKELLAVEYDDVLRNEARSIPDVDFAMIAQSIIQPMSIGYLNVHLDVICCELPFKNFFDNVSREYFSDVSLSNVMLNCYNKGHRGLCTVGYEGPADEELKNLCEQTSVTFTIYIYLDSEPHMLPFEIEGNLHHGFRSYVLATEFICAYRGFVQAVEKLSLEGVDAMYSEDSVLVCHTSNFSPDQSITSEDLDKMMNGKAPFDHATSSDVIRLLCSYKSIDTVLKDVSTEMGIDNPDLDFWVKTLRDEKLQREGVELKFLHLYKKRWEEHERVDFRLVRKKTWEFFVSQHTSH